ncbi:hypothetical protein HY992_06075 [Candidatus Micrarchaeota archaeon]|nr:hypothetical protein [Candidatus Micrarchaeota archaeon]
MIEIKRGIIIIRPCTVEENVGKISGEAHVSYQAEGKQFSFERKKFGELLAGQKAFEKLKFSEKIGIAKFEHEGKIVLFSVSGRIIVRAARDSEDVFDTVKLAAETAWHSAICPVHGQLAGKCVEKQLECVAAAKPPQLKV